jgi:hypothetical protein
MGLMAFAGDRATEFLPSNMICRCDIWPLIWAGEDVNAPALTAAASRMARDPRGPGVRIDYQAFGIIDT